MGFSGGGGGGAITNHVHSSQTGEGGSLSTGLTELAGGSLYSRILIGA